MNGSLTRIKERRASQRGACEGAEEEEVGGCCLALPSAMGGSKDAALNHSNDHGRGGHQPGGDWPRRATHGIFAAFEPILARESRFAPTLTELGVHGASRYFSCAPRHDPDSRATMPAIRGPESKSKTRRWRRALDQIHADLHDPKHLAQHKDSKVAEDLPGLGLHYCIECAKWFENDNNLVAHRKGKPHKRRVRQLKDDPYTQKEAEAAVGLTTDNGKRPEAMAVDDFMDDSVVPDPRAALVMPQQATDNESHLDAIR